MKTLLITTSQSYTMLNAIMRHLNWMIANKTELRNERVKGIEREIC